jgi:putative endonuclease
MRFWVYILRCADGSYYTGHTDNLEARMAKHKTGETEGYTSTRLPVELVFSEQFSTREEALTCERQIKGWTRKKKEALMRGDWAEVSRLAHRGRVSRTSELVLSKAHPAAADCEKSPSTSSGRTASKR